MSEFSTTFFSRIPREIRDSISQYYLKPGISIDSSRPYRPSILIKSRIQVEFDLMVYTTSGMQWIREKFRKFRDSARGCSSCDLYPNIGLAIYSTSCGNYIQFLSPRIRIYLDSEETLLLLIDKVEDYLSTLLTN